LRLRQIYSLAIQAGIKADCRPKEEIERLLKVQRERYERLEPGEKELFDRERLTNPFADTRVLFGDPESEVETVMVGIDIGPAELLLADRLRSSGVGIDLVISHHPQGQALAGLADVMRVQTDLLAERGVPIGIAEGIFSTRIKDVASSVSSSNHNRAVDVAKLLQIPFMCIHTPADNCVTAFLDSIFKSKRPYLLGDVIDMLLKIEEYRSYAAQIAKPRVVAGSRENRAGEIYVDMTGGTSGPESLYEMLSKSTSISTIVCMSLSNDHKKEIEKYHLNCIVAPHMPSDTLGLNLVLDELEARQKLNIIECSGFRRVNRTKGRERDEK